MTNSTRLCVVTMLSNMTSAEIEELLKLAVILAIDGQVFIETSEHQRLALEGALTYSDNVRAADYWIDEQQNMHRIR